MANPLTLARLLLMQGKPLPTDLAARLMAMGVDVPALEKRFAQ